MATARKTAPAAAAGPRWRVRVRMYRHGLGDCFLLSFRQGSAMRHVLIDCGALSRDRTKMTALVQSIRDTVRGRRRKARLDVVVATHEHKDHVSGFNQARALFRDEFDIGSVWMGWTENLSEPEVRRIRETRRKAQLALGAVLAGRGGAALADVAPLLGFSADDDSVGERTVAQAMEYLKQRGRDAGDLRFLEPGGAPFALPGVDGVHVYVLGPPLDPQRLKTSAVTEAMKREGVIYHLAATGEMGLDALATAAGIQPLADPATDRHQPFAPQHRLPRRLPALDGMPARDNPYLPAALGDVLKAYDDPLAAWRRVDDDWLAAYGQLALDLDNDTNNTSLVLAFEFERGGEVLLFAADAQVGSWLSWADLRFDVPGRPDPLPAHDLLRRTVFYKVGHHCSHNATLKAGGLELMTSERLTAFVPLDQATARVQGSKGWEMPAPPLAKALRERTGGRLVISDVAEPLPAAAAKAGVEATPTHIDYLLT